MKKIFYIFISFFFCSLLAAQSVFLSVENQYYDFLILSGSLESTTLNYKSLSDLNYTTDTNKLENTIWNSIQFDKQINITDNFSYKIFSPELFISYNTTSPYGTNDESLWQGKGINAEFDGGALIKFYGFELTILPEITFSQNLSFEYMKPNYSGANFEGKADTYGGYGLTSIDAPQRFGNKSFFSFDWGQSEIRYTYNEFTIGFGTQSIWLGPANLNPIIHSNNATSYPKLDLGIKKKNLNIKDLWLGNIEFRYWLGQLHESDYFDNNNKNDRNLITGLSLAYELPFFKGLSLGFNRTMISKWDDISPYSLFTLLVPFMEKSAGFDENDQRAALIANYAIPSGKVDIYIEWAKNDYNIGLDNLIRYPFHTQAFTLGFDKAIQYSNSLFAKLVCEISYLESSMDYHFFYDWGGIGNSFYTHHIIVQGYTNNGQYLGAGIGSGGNSQYLGFDLYYPKGSTSFFIQRTNPDLNYSYFQDTEEGKKNDEKKSSIRATLDFGINSFYYFDSKIQTRLSFVFRDEHNPLNENRNEKSIHRYNAHISLWIKYIL